MKSLVKLRPGKMLTAPGLRWRATLLVMAETLIVSVPPLPSMIIFYGYLGWKNWQICGYICRDYPL